MVFKVHVRGGYEMCVPVCGLKREEKERERNIHTSERRVFSKGS